ncbi:Peptidase family S41 [Chitinophaga jiangningensis]|uniref:Peptidase family S41 n=1 Tax=Chitinophaga jiangningensis TaxID=1419482 RepID=A0A1M7A761_9BACT|nr:S41 family peptidase [Chitinophaga jiangningensis]SHL38513.1 Peptidase family S41 [Chitinophaga jiangningensis]
MRTLLLFIILIPNTLSAQRGLTKKYSPEQCQEVFNNVITLLKTSHPGTFRYHSKADFEEYAASVSFTMRDSMTELELYRKLKPLVTYMGCLHTELITAVNYKGWLDKSPNLVPLQLFWEGKRAFVTVNLSENINIVPGDEVLEINGRRIPALLDLLLPVIPADGYNQSMKYLALYHLFPLLYRSNVEVLDSFRITWMHMGNKITSVVPAVGRCEFARRGLLSEYVYSKQLVFTTTDSMAVLTIHSFANTAIKAGKQHFKTFIDQVFDTLKVRGVPNLIIDLRYNTGGSDVNAAYFSSYFFDKPYRYWDRIEVTATVAGKVKGLGSLLFHKPVQRDSAWLWQKGKTVKDFDFTELQQPAANHYNGKVYVLINGFSMSSCADVAAILSHNRKAVFIGTETGGGYQGNNSGIIPGVNLRPTKLVLSVPLMAYYNAVDATVNMGRGTMPDIPVDLTLTDILNNVDRPMKVAMDQINRKGSL